MKITLGFDQLSTTDISVVKRVRYIYIVYLGQSTWTLPDFFFVIVYISYYVQRDKVVLGKPTFFLAAEMCVYYIHII